MSDPQPQLLRSLDEQRAEYARRRGLAMPLAGSIVWTLIGIAGAFLPPILAVWSLFIGTGFIAYLGIMLSRFTGENFLDKNKPKNVFDSLFFHCRDGTTRLRDRHPVFPRRLHVIAADGRYPGRANVGTALLDHPALGRDLSRRSADGSGDGRMVPCAASSVRGHSGGHRGRLRGHDCHPGAALARRQPQHRRSRYGVNPARH